MYALRAYINRTQILKSKTSSKESIAHNPYFSYDQELFGHDEDNTPDLQEN